MYEVCMLFRWFSARLFSLDNCVFHSFYSKGIVSVIFTRNTTDLFISIIYIIQLLYNLQQRVHKDIRVYLNFISNLIKIKNIYSIALSGT